MTTATKIDMRKELHELYAPPQYPMLVEVPPIQYLMVDGILSASSTGPGDDPAFREAPQALYSVTYTMKFDAKSAGLGDYALMPLEGLFWTNETGVVRPEELARMRWTLMIAQPITVTQSSVDGAIDHLLERGKVTAPPAVRLETLDEGQAAQILHLGPYAAEAPTIERLHAFIDERGFVKRGKHHEIYLSDPNRTSPARLRTVIRQPVAIGA